MSLARHAEQVIAAGHLARLGVRVRVRVRAGAGAGAGAGARGKIKAALRLL